jgi:enoyl-CoA hydratase
VKTLPSGTAAGKRRFEVLTDEPVIYERRGSCAIVTINRPAVRNAVNGVTADLLEAAYEQWVADGDARVMVLTGAGSDAFCAGADLKDIASLTARVNSSAGPLGFTRKFAPKPVIAAIEGWCVAGGLELALWCDLRIAAGSARFGCTERRFGVPLIDGGTQRMPRIIGLGRAMDLILTGRVIDAPEAERIGLVNEVVTDGAALERAVELAAEIAALPWPTLLADRSAALQAQGIPLEEGLKREAQLGAETVDTGAMGAERFKSGEGRHGGSISKPAT